MPCNCSGVRMKKCSCKVFGYPAPKYGTQNVVLVEEDLTNTTTSLQTSHKIEKLNYFMKILDRFYGVCAGYNLRYCPLMGRPIRDKHLTNAAKDLIILMCFLVANFIVFLNIWCRMIFRVYLASVEVFKWIQWRAFKTSPEERIMFRRK